MNTREKLSCNGRHGVAAQRVEGRTEGRFPMLLSGEDEPNTGDEARGQATLFVRGGAKDGATVPILHERIAMGSLRDNDLVFEEPGVSRRHAEIFRTDGGYHLIDLADTQTTFVNGASIGQTEHVLQDGDEIRLAKSSMSLVFRYVQREVPEDHGVSDGDIDYDLSSILGDIVGEAEPVDQPGQLDQLPDDQMYEGTVRLLVEPATDIGQVLRIVGDLQKHPQLRVVQVKTARKLGVEIMLALREPVRLRDLLAGIDGVSQVLHDETPGSSDSEASPDVLEPRERVLSLQLAG